MRWRTMLAALGFLIVGVLDVVGAIDLRPLVAAFVAEKEVGAVMVGLSLIFGVLRLITTSPVWPKE
jgi:hypothetical protein